MLPLTSAADQNASSSLSAASVVSVSALVFTVASFWWLNARQGRLKSWEPQSFAAIVHGSMVRLRLPLVLHNTGAKPIVVQDLRLTFPDEPASHLPLLWTSSPSRLQPGPDEEPALPAGFVVGGREAQQLFIEFEAPFSGFIPEARDYKVRILVWVGHRKVALTSDVHLEDHQHHSSRPVRRLQQRPSRTNEGRPEKADAALLELLEGQDKGETKRRDSSDDEGNTGTNL